VTCALLAGDLLPKKFAIHPQLAAAMRAVNIVAPQRQFDDSFDLLQRHEFRNLDAVGVEIRIKECPAVAAMNDLFGHLFAAFRAWTTWPWGHFVFLLKRESAAREPGAPLKAMLHSPGAARMFA
jgi:hypothetical protein